MTTFTANFTVDSWDEKPINQVAGTSKLTSATVAKTYVGDIDGRSITEWLMSYSNDGSATDDMTGCSGTGDFSADPAGRVTLRLDVGVLSDRVGAVSSARLTNGPVGAVARDER